MKGAFLLALVLSCIATVCAKMPWGLSGRRVGGTVKTGSAKESLHAGNKTNCRLGRDVQPARDGDDIPPSSSALEDDVKPARDGDDIPPSSSALEDDVKPARDGDDIPPSNTPPPQKGGWFSSFGEKGLCCVGGGIDRMANGRVEASTNVRAGMGDIRNGMGESSTNIRNGMYAIGVCMVLSNEKILIGFYKAASGLLAWASS
jgi:hypothetical protein